MDIQNETLEEVSKRYKLTEEESMKISSLINEIMLSNKKAVSKPTAIIDIAPPGSGKTGLNGFGLQQFKDGNVVIINSDELKPFHPKIDEIAKKYPQYYTKVTNQESNLWTDRLFDEAIEKRYNVIFEGTGRNLKLLKSMIDKMHDYRILVRGMAVNELNCLMSIIERYEGQVNKKGWGRLVTKEHFYQAYDEMLDTIGKLEELPNVDTIEVYMRGNSPTSPVKIYGDKDTEYLNVTSAVVNGRMADKKRAILYYNESFRKSISEFKNIEEEKDILNKIKILVGEKEISKGDIQSGR